MVSWFERQVDKFLRWVGKGANWLLFAVTTPPDADFEEWYARKTQTPDKEDRREKK